jgi:hypothetical protein
MACHILGAPMALHLNRKLVSVECVKKEGVSLHVPQGVGPRYDFAAYRRAASEGLLVRRPQENPKIAGVPGRMARRSAHILAVEGADAVPARCGPRVTTSIHPAGSSVFEIRSPQGVHTPLRFPCPMAASLSATA